MYYRYNFQAKSLTTISLNKDESDEKNESPTKIEEDIPQLENQKVNKIKANYHCTI